MKILITGATGFIGQKLLDRLLGSGHQMAVLSRDAERARERLAVPVEAFSWDPEAGPPSGESLEGVEAVVHLAGEPVAEKRWDHERKRRIHASRVVGTENLMKGLAAMERPPKVVVSASAIGFFGDRGDDALNETSAPGEDFLAKVVRDWEAAALLNAPKETRVVLPRIGVVLDRAGGALERMVPLFQAGVGGAIGSGKQWMSWIHVEDLLSILERSIEDPGLSGPLNAVAPNPVRNRQFAEGLAEAMKTRLFPAVPSAVIRTVFGQMASVILGSQRSVPERLEGRGFRFRYADLDDALAAIFESDASRAGECFDARSWVPRPPEEVFEFFADEKNLETLSPDWMGLVVERKSSEKLGEGTRIDCRLKVRGVPLRWQSRITDWRPGASFSDEQVKGPFRSWKHTHRFEGLAGGTLIRDRVYYRLPAGPIGQALGARLARRDVAGVFEFRRQRIADIFPA